MNLIYANCLSKVLYLSFKNIFEAYRPDNMNNENSCCWKIKTNNNIWATNGNTMTMLFPKIIKLTTNTHKLIYHNKIVYHFLSPLPKEEY